MKENWIILRYIVFHKCCRCLILDSSLQIFLEQHFLLPVVRSSMLFSVNSFFWWQYLRRHIVLPLNSIIWTWNGYHREKKAICKLRLLSYSKIISIIKLENRLDIFLSWLVDYKWYHTINIERVGDDRIRSQKV